MTESTKLEMKERPQTETAKPAADPLVPTVFHEPWWLRAATGGEYEQTEVSDGYRIVGRLPFAIWKRPGRKISTLPALVPRLGPAVYEGTGSSNTKFMQRYRVTKELIAKLPTLHRFRQRLHRGYPEAISFQSEGFRTGVQFTFEIQPQSELDAWNKLRNKTRNVIRRAQEDLEVQEMEDPHEFLRFYEANLAARGLRMHQPRAETAAVCLAALEKKSAKLLCARDRQRRLAAAVFLPFDANAAYYLMTSRTLDSGNGAVSLLIWTGIRFCSQHALTFNFDGIGSDGTMLLYAGFGGEPKPIYIVSKDSTRVKLADFCREITGLFGHENRFDRC